MATEYPTFASPGVSATEIDLTGPTPGKPIGVPAGIIGTSNEGPAFVPVTVANFNEYSRIFGASDGEKFGPLAVYEWLRNAQACTFLRVLGAGDGKKRSDTTGAVTYGGCTVGNETVQDNGNVGTSKYAYSHKAATAEVAQGGTLGRTYFMGHFASESNGSTIFSEAGIQIANSEPAAAAYLTDAITCAGGATDTDTLTITMPAGYGADAGIAVEILFDADMSGTPTANQIIVDVAAGTAAQIALLIRVINGFSDESTIKYGSGIAAGPTNGIDGLTASAGSTAAILTLTADTATILGDSITLATTDATITLAAAALSGGADGEQVRSAPIIRGVLLAPSGVVLTLSGNHVGGSTLLGEDDGLNTPVPGIAAKGDRRWPTTGTPLQRGYGIDDGPYGALTGSVDLGTQEFTMILCGHIDNPTNAAPNVITASFELTAPNYFGNVFNTDPLKIGEKGHLLYSRFDIHPDFYTLTGSGIINASAMQSSSMGGREDDGFITTGSMARDTYGSNGPNYEGFNDRFTTALSPWIVSQAFGGKAYKLFRIHSIDI